MPSVQFWLLYNLFSVHRWYREFGHSGNWRNSKNRLCTYMQCQKAVFLYQRLALKLQSCQFQFKMLFPGLNENLLQLDSSQYFPFMTNPCWLALIMVNYMPCSTWNLQSYGAHKFLHSFLPFHWQPLWYKLTQNIDCVSFFGISKNMVVEITVSQETRNWKHSYKQT